MKRFTFWQALLNAEFWLLLVTAACGLFGLAWWFAVPLCVAGLAISGLPKYGAGFALWETVALSLLGAVVGSVAVFVFGAALRVLLP